MKNINKSKKFKMAILLFLLLFLFNGKLPHKNLFKSILNMSKGTIVENGIKIVNEDKLGNEKKLRSILDNLNIDKKHIKSYTKSEKISTIEFQKENLRGYIQQESIKDKNLSRTTITLINKGSENILEDLKKVGKQLFNQDVKIYSYMKARIYTEDLYNLNKKIIGGFYDNLENIDTIKITNGYSTFFKKRCFQYALVNYSSGSYLIMGEPQIFELY